MKGSINLHLPDEFTDKVKWLCKKCPRNEWSGILYYQMEGTITDPSNVKLTAKDIFLMDIGSKTHTAYSFDEEVLNYEMDEAMSNPEFGTYIRGHIHSHNDMKVFFSGEDDSELTDNAPNHNIYLSIIVNNFGDVTARLVFKATPTVFSCLDEHGDPYNLPITGVRDVVFYRECNIHSNLNQVTVEDSFLTRFSTVQKNVAERERIAMEERKAAAAALAAKNQGNQAGFNRGTHYPPSSGGYAGGYGGAYQGSYQGGFSENPTMTGWNSGIDDKDLAGLEEETDSDYEDFIMYVLGFGSHADEGIELKHVLGTFQSLANHRDDVVNTVLSDYPRYYQTFFDEQAHIEEDEFMEILEEVIEVLEGYEKEYTVLTDLTLGLRMLGNKFEEMSLNQSSL